MNRKRVIIGAAGLIAVVIGILASYPLIVSDLPSLSRINLEVETAYVYIQPIDSNVTGLFLNNSIVDVNCSESLPSGTIKADGFMVSYIAVLNITNNSDDPVRITNFDFILGPSDHNPVISDLRHFSYLSQDAEIWSSHSSRYIGLSGITGVHEVAFSTLNNTIQVSSHIEGKLANANAGGLAIGSGIKQIQFEQTKAGYLYNDLLTEDQVLLFYSGLSVSIAKRQ